MQTFESLGLTQDLLKAVDTLGFSEPTEIQNSAIPPLLEGRDVLGQAQTGTGKTAAFGLPMIDHIDPKNHSIQALVLTPTRELAIQVCDALQDFGKYSNIKTAPVYGGQSYTIQFRRLERHPHIVVGTPGRVIDLIKRNALHLNQVSYLVIDEADEMLNMGFIEDVETIIGETPRERQTSLFSATLTRNIRQLASKHLNDPQEIIIHSKKITVDKITQRCYLLSEKDKMMALMRLIEYEDIESALIFTRTKIKTAELAEALIENHISAEGLHGDMKQVMRERVLERFREKKIRFLVATGIAARGLDIEDVSHVINFDIPEQAEEYVHRIGRTGRAGNSGTAISFLTPKEQKRIRSIERYTKKQIEFAKLPSIADIREKRDERFCQKMVTTMTEENYVNEHNLASQLVHWGYDPLDIAAAAIKLLNEKEKQTSLKEIREVSFLSDQKNNRNKHKPRKRSANKKRNKGRHEPGMVRFSMELGHKHNIRPGTIVGAIANGAGIPGNAIGAIDIQEKQTYLDIAEEYTQIVNRRMGNWKYQGHPAMLQPED